MKRLARCAALIALAMSCRPGAIDWGLDRVDAMVTPPDDPTLGCGPVVPADTKRAERAACTYRAGARPSETLGIDRALLARLPIRHVIIAMRENRSFDHILGKLHDQGQPEVEPIPAGYSNPDREGRAVLPHHATTTCLPLDPPHQFEGMTKGVNGGKMDGFVLSAADVGGDGAYALTYYEQTDLPFYYFLANTYAMGDRHFSPMAAGTFGNRNYMMFGTSAGVLDTGVSYPDPSLPSIFHIMMNRGVTWRVYTDGNPFSSTLDWNGRSPGVRPLRDLYDALDKGTLPNVSFADGIENIDDDHPDGDLQRGEAWLKVLYDHAIKSPQWERLAIFFTYDEGGGFFDHVPPPEGCRAYLGRPEPEMMGPRVPMVAISPWAKRHYVSHLPRDHTSITRFIETIFDLPALTGRDANADAMLDMFDFSCRDLGIPPAPAPATGGCLR